MDHSTQFAVQHTYASRTDDYDLIYSEEAPLECPKCRKTFQHKGRLEHHLKAGVCDSQFQCNICLQVFSKRYQYTKHLHEHNDRPKYKCQFCGSRFIQESSYEHHLLYEHGDSIRKDTLIIKCEGCDAKFYRATKYREHLKKCQPGSVAVYCNTCGKAFTTEGSLKIHVRIHTGERPYVCKYCRNTYIASGDLRKHERTHTGEKRYFCTTCGERFMYRQTLITHMTQHERKGAIGNYCALCNISFQTKAQLRQHHKLYHAYSERNQTFYDYQQRSQIDDDDDDFDDDDEDDLDDDDDVELSMEHSLVMHSQPSDVFPSNVVSSPIPRSSFGYDAGYAAAAPSTARSGSASTVRVTSFPKQSDAPPSSVGLGNKRRSASIVRATAMTPAASVASTSASQQQACTSTTNSSSTWRPAIEEHVAALISASARELSPDHSPLYLGKRARVSLPK